MTNTTASHHSPPEPETLAIIPARGGSKGIPRKNIVDLCGAPLLAYSIRTALAAQRVSRVVVSTDDEEIAAVAREWGAETPFLRPRSISGDRAYMGDAIEFMLRMLRYRQGYEPDNHCVLYPTHPFRTPALVDSLLEKLEEYTYVRTARAVDVDRRTFFALSDAGMLQPQTAGASSAPASHGRLFRQYGVFAANRCDWREPGPGNEYVHVLTDPVHYIDIDGYSDLYLAEEIINSGLFHFGTP